MPIHKRPNGKWRADRGPAGHRHARHFARKVDGQRWLDEQTTAIVSGQYVDPRAGRVTFRVCAEQHRKAAPHSTATADKVRRTLERHAYPTFGDLPVSTIRPSMVQAWVIGLPLAPATAKVVLGYVSQVFRAAVRDRIVTSNPRDGVQLPGARSKQVEIPELATVEAVRAALPARFRAVVDLVVFTTAAGGPVTRSQWSQIWRPTVRAAAVPEREGLHALRHFYASALIRHGSWRRLCSGGSGTRRRRSRSTRTRTCGPTATTAPAKLSRRRSVAFVATQ